MQANTGINQNDFSNSRTLACLRPTRRTRAERRAAAIAYAAALEVLG